MIISISSEIALACRPCGSRVLFASVGDVLTRIPIALWDPVLLLRRSQSRCFGRLGGEYYNERTNQ